MKRLFVLAAVAALALPATAIGKGPSGASINGPGSGGGINISGDGESGGTPLGDLTQQAGFFPAAFGQQPDPMLKDAPEGTLGPKYTIDYTVPGPNNDTFHIKQDVYPYATPNPVTYMEPGQKIFDMETRGGWFQSDATLKDTLATAGLPEVAPGGSSAADDGIFSAELMSALGGALLLAAAAWIVMRRRTRPAPAA
jgi:hypothetical protein